MSVESLATAKRLFAEATEVHREAVNKLHGITERLGTIRNRLSEITQARVAGTATGQDADEFVLLTADAELLGSMLAEAQRTVQKLQSIATARLNELQTAEKIHALDQAGIEFAALSMKTREIEAVFVRAIAMTHAAGRKLGYHVLSQSWRASEPLDKAMRLNVPPEVY